MRMMGKQLLWNSSEKSCGHGCHTGGGGVSLVLRERHTYMNLFYDFKTKNHLSVEELIHVIEKAL